MKKSSLFLSILLICPLMAQAVTHVFSVQPSVKAPSKIVKGRTALVTYTVTNQSSRFLANNGVADLVPGLTQDTTQGCGKFFDLEGGQSCQLYLKVNSTANTTIAAGPTVCHTLSSKVFCNRPEKTTNRIYVAVVNSPDSSFPLLTVTPIKLKPGILKVVTIKNTSTTTAANNVNIILPEDMQNDMESVVANGCGNVAPGGTCTINMTTKSSVDEDHFPQDATVEGSNTQNTSVSVDLDVPRLSASDVHFAAPGNEQMTLTSLTSKPLDVTNIQVEGLTNVTGPTPSTCHLDGLYDTCKISFIATDNAMGNGSTTIDYTYNGVNESITSSILVDPTALSMDSEMKLDPNKTGQLLTIKNTGNFNWINPVVQLSHSINNVSMDASACTGSTIAPNESCHVSFDTNDALIGANSQLHVEGDNVSDTQYVDVVVDGGVVVTPILDPENQHLGYRSLKVENLSSKNISFSGADIPGGLSGEIEYCSSGNTDCKIQSTCQEGSTLAPNRSCEVEFKALDEAPFIGHNTGDVTINYTMDNSSLSQTVPVTYERQLYATGNFTMTPAGESPIYNIASWDHTSWNALGSNDYNGVNGIARVLTSDIYGDLIVGGDFTGAGDISANRIARWNGATWHSLSTGMNHNVYALIHDSDGSVIAGGAFTTAGNVAANRIAKWNPETETWTTYGAGFGDGNVYALLNQDGYFIAGGDFTQDGQANPLLRVAQWNNNLSQWSQVGDEGLQSGEVRTLHLKDEAETPLIVGGIFRTSVGANEAREAWIPLNPTQQPVYWKAISDITDGEIFSTIAHASFDRILGGSFTTSATGSVPGVGYYEGNELAPLGGGVNGTAYSLLMNGDQVVAAGDFTQAGGNDGNKIAIWDGSNWGSLNTGLSSGTVYSTIILPSLNFS